MVDVSLAGQKYSVSVKLSRAAYHREGRSAGSSTIVEDVDKNVRNLLQVKVMHLTPMPRKRAGKPAAADFPVCTVPGSLTSAPE
jgi:hypothetical protein